MGPLPAGFQRLCHSYFMNQQYFWISNIFIYIEYFLNAGCSFVEFDVFNRFQNPECMCPHPIQHTHLFWFARIFGYMYMWYVWHVMCHHVAFRPPPGILSPNQPFAPELLKIQPAALRLNSLTGSFQLQWSYKWELFTIFPVKQGDLQPAGRFGTSTSLPYI